MTIEDEYGIDRITESLDGRTASLVMVEERQFTDSDEQIEQLVAKINTYVAYIQTGQLYSDFPQLAGRPLDVVLVCLEEPEGQRYRELLNLAAGLFDKHGAHFRIDVVPPDLIGLDY